MNLSFKILTPEMDRSAFCCGQPALDEYFKTQARQDMKRGYATVVAASDVTRPNEVIGFYTLSAASVNLKDLPYDTARRLPRYPQVPAIRLGRLAVSTSMQGQKVGTRLVLNAIEKAFLSEVAWAVLIVDAKDEQACVFYQKFLFERFQRDSHALWMLRKQASLLIP